MNAAAVYSCGCGQSSAAGQCLNALQGAGISVGNQEEKRGRHSVLLFEEPSEEVCRLLREMCCQAPADYIPIFLTDQDEFSSTC